MLLVSILFFLFMMLGMPIAFSIGIAGFVYFLQNPTLTLTIPVQLTLTQTQNFTMLSIPLFILAGNLLNETGITKRLLQMASVLAGHLRGGLAQINIVLALMMGGITSSAIGDATMLGRVLGPGMIKRKYSRGFAAGVIGFSSIITTMIPPGTGLVLYGSIGEVSIGRLFMGGVIPGFLLAFSMMLAIAITAKRHNYQPEHTERPKLKKIATTSVDCIWGLLFPVLLLIGMRTGIFTPSEVGSFAVVYAIFVGIFMHKELTWKKLMDAIENTAIDIGMIMLLICLSALFSYGLVWDRIPQMFATGLLSLSSEPWVIMVLLVGFLFVAGTFMDSTVLILLLTSILVPVATQLGLDPIHFGIVMVLTMTLGQLTPPEGAVLYIACSIFNCTIIDFVKESWLLLLGVLIVILLVALFPQLTLFLPNLIYG